MGLGVTLTPAIDVGVALRALDSSVAPADRRRLQEVLRQLLHRRDRVGEVTLLHPCGGGHLARAVVEDDQVRRRFA
ncbi:MAG: hypothetical protein V9E99_03570 [Microthrixaceae bacterium]